MAKSAKASRPSTGKMRCAIYTRKSSEEGLEQAFNSLDAQREACAAFILSQHYLYDLKLKRVEAAAGELDEMRKGARLALDEAGKAKFWAAAAFIIAGGAMLAAMAAAFIAFLALRRYGFQPPW
jgi:hypothetical protein